MAVNKLVSISKPIFDAFEDMGKEVTNDLPLFAKWATQAAVDISSLYSFKKKIAVLRVKGCSAEIPCCAAGVKYVLLGDHGTDCGLVFDSYYGQIVSTSIQTVGVNTAFLVVDNTGGYNCSCSSANWVIQDNHIVFNTSSLDGSKITIQYLGFEEDESGLPMVSENAAPAIVEYIMWKYCVRSQYGKNALPMGLINMHRMEYNRLASDARALDASPTDPEYQRMIAMINDPLSGWGFGVPMYSPLDFNY